jgi:hypothetical protein
MQNQNYVASKVGAEVICPSSAVGGTAIRLATALGVGALWTGLAFSAGHSTPTTILLGGTEQR